MSDNFNNKDSNIEEITKQQIEKMQSFINAEEKKDDLKVSWLQIIALVCCAVIVLAGALIA